MATLVVVLLCLKVFSTLLSPVQASTHWVVTEDGRIQAQLDSVFSMRKPYDLVALLKQEQRAHLLEGLKQELLTKKEEIDKNEDKDTGLEQRFYRTDSDCMAAGKPLPEFDLYISTVLPLENKGIRPEEHLDFKAPPTVAPVPPDCSQVIDLDFSMHAFEHLEGMKERVNLTGNAELGLKNAITHRDNVDDYGHLVHEALQKNQSSWVLYNMAAFYWRIKGSPLHVIECLRRALHFSPRMQKDVALISLANVLHRSRYSSEAAVVVHAALDVSKELNVNHFTLGNIYAVLAEYNKSVICFENTLKIQPDFEAASKRKHAVLCHAKLENALEAQHRSLQRTLNELKDYQQKHEHWQVQQEKLLSEQASTDTKFEQRVGYEEHKVREMTAKVAAGEFCTMQEKDGRQVIHCTWGRKSPLLTDLDLEWHHGSAKEEGQTDSEGEGGSESVRPTTAPPVNYNKPVRPPLYASKRTATPELLSKLPYKAKDWPSKEECDTFVQKYPNWNDFPMTYLPAENKGFEVKALLAESQGLSKNSQHMLPWYPPECQPLCDIPEGPKSYDHLQSMKDRAKAPNKLSDTSMREVLLSLVDVDDIREEDIGQRILTALKQDLGPSWLLYNLAGLYWRVTGNSQNGLECLRRALFHCPRHFRDVPLVNLANILYKWGRVDDAVTVVMDALAVNDFEPETHFLLANLLAAKGNQTGAIHHYEEALLQDPSHKEAFTLLRSVRCDLKFHRSAQSAAPKDGGPKPCVASCQKAAPPQVKNVDSRVICKNENGKETCIVETQTGSCSTCKQTCSVSPVKIEHCGGPDPTVQSECGAGKCPPSRCKCTYNPPVSCGNSKSGSSSPPVEDDVITEQCSHHITDPIPDTLPGSSIIEREINAHLDEISQYYRDEGACTGEDCNRLMIQTPPNQKPHTRLEIINGALHQKLIFVDGEADLEVTPTDCVIFNDGHKSEGCNQEEFQPFDFDEYHFLSEREIFRFHDDNANPLFYPEQDDDDGGDPDSLDRKFNVPIRKHYTGNGPIKFDIDDYEFDVKNMPYDDLKKSVMMNDEEILRFSPDPARHVHKRAKIEWPTWDSCRQKYLHINFNQFVSTWVSPTTKGINVRDHVDFVNIDENNLAPEPECDTSLIRQPTALRVIHGVQHPEELVYSVELGLREALQKIGGEEPEDEMIVGVRIAQALAKNPTSWVLANLAALYWRVSGDQVRAIECIQVAYAHSPKDSRDIALLSLANILHNCGQLDDALQISNLALEVAPELVAIHFTLANILAAKEMWGRAVLFYEATLGLQSSFKPARVRLRAIRCDKVLSNPHIYKPADKNKKKKPKNK